MTIDQQIAVMQAFKEGKTIEYKNKAHDGWSVNSDPAWNFDDYDYRVKPEPNPTKYKPFSFKDDLVGKVVVLQNMYKAIISGQSPSRVHISGYDNPVLYNDLLKGWTFIDGSPCGKLKNE